MIDLWDLAQTANFTEKELESFRVRKQGGEAVSPSIVNSISFGSPVGSGSLFLFLILQCLHGFLLFNFLTLASAALVIPAGSQVVAGGHTRPMPAVSVPPGCGIWL